jgi:hypothetical protein
MSTFLKMAETITEEVAAGRLTAKEAKRRLIINADIAAGLEVKNKLWQLSRNKVRAWDGMEKTALEIFAANNFATMRIMFDRRW